RQASHNPAPPARPGGARRPAAGPLKSKRSAVVTALAIAGAAVVGILLASVLSNGGGSDGQAQDLTTTTTAQAAGGEPSTSSTKRTSIAPPKVTGEPTAQQQEQAIRDYFALLPDGVDEGFSRLTADMQAAAGGPDGYAGWWKLVKSVEVTGMRVNESFAYEVDLTFTMKDGTVSRERKLVVLKWDHDSLLISKEQLLAKA
ncbi:serine/threonine protein kinase, partial [Saccharothrix hoggarensis]